MIKKLGRILTYIVTFIGGFIAAIVALFKLAGKVLDTKSQFGRNSITTLKDYICDQVETLFFGQPRNRRSGSYYNYYDTTRFVSWKSPEFKTKEEAKDFLEDLTKIANRYEHAFVVDAYDVLNKKDRITNLDYSFGWTLSQIERARTRYWYTSNTWTVTLPQPQRL